MQSDAAGAAPLAVVHTATAGANDGNSSSNEGSSSNADSSSSSSTGSGVSMGGVGSQAAAKAAARARAAARAAEQEAALKATVAAANGERPARPFGYASGDDQGIEGSSSGGGSTAGKGPFFSPQLTPWQSLSGGSGSGAGGGGSSGRNGRASSLGRPREPLGKAAPLRPVDLVAQEKFTFESWLNVRLASRGLFVEDLFRDLRSGVLLAHLAEVRALSLEHTSFPQRPIFACPSQPPAPHHRVSLYNATLSFFFPFTGTEFALSRERVFACELQVLSGRRMPDVPGLPIVHASTLPPAPDKPASHSADAGELAAKALASTVTALKATAFAATQAAAASSAPFLGERFAANQAATSGTSGKGQGREREKQEQQRRAAQLEKSQRDFLAAGARDALQGDPMGICFKRMVHKHAYYALYTPLSSHAHPQDTPPAAHLL
jgi:hypothetical protein